ncbi:Methionine--tRNA ligase [Desulfovibrionales bacterium]
MAFYITTPIYYVNARPHLGHAYTTIVADALARFRRSFGEPTIFLTGTDEHGDKIVRAAQEHRITPKTYVDEISSLYRDLWFYLDIDYDIFIRTTEERHERCVQEILRRIYEAGDIYFGDYDGYYCFGCERFYTEKELVNDLCPQHLERPEFITDKNYFFRMSRHQSWLIDYIKQHREFIRPEGYRNEVLSLLESGALEDLCISRPKTRLSWGIELPFDRDYVCYVWFDALLNYVTALDWPVGETFQSFWPGAQHVVAKDILKPHAIFWPTILRAAGFEPYRHLNVHGYWLMQDTKMSKSLGNVVDPRIIVKKYGLAAFRYFLLREMHFGHDASFSEESFIARFNANLANDLGNLFSRTLSMTHKYFGGMVPQPAELAGASMAEVSKSIDGIQVLALDALRNYCELFERVEFSRALEALWELVRGMNRYIDHITPWALYKAGDTERLGAVIYTVLEGMRKVAVALWPVMPEMAERMLGQLGMAVSAGDRVDLAVELDVWGLLPAGVAVAAGSNLFPRVNTAKVNGLARIHGGSKMVAPTNSQIT